jgi:hypothetical protein
VRSSPLLLCFLLACVKPAEPPVSPGGTASEAAAAPSPQGSGPTNAAAEASQEKAPGAAAPKAIPWSCGTDDEGICVPEPGFVNRLCNGAFPDAALTLLSKEAPFTRMYLRGDVDGWNADGGMSARARLRFDEEVLVLKRRTAPKTGIVVGTGGGYHVMRWDGNCYTLDDSELTTKKPPSPKFASIPWRYLSERTRDSLLQDAKVLAAYQRRGKECKGAASGEVTKACEQADAALSAAVVSEVRSGNTVPTPEKIP